MDKYINTISEKSNGYDGECILLVILKIDLKGKDPPEVKNAIEEKMSECLSEICNNHKTLTGRVLNLIYNTLIEHDHVILSVQFMPYSNWTEPNSCNNWENQAIDIVADISQLLSHDGSIYMYKLPVVHSKEIRVIYK